MWGGSSGRRRRHQRSSSVVIIIIIIEGLSLLQSTPSVVMYGIASLSHNNTRSSPSPGHGRLAPMGMGMDMDAWQPGQVHTGKPPPGAWNQLHTRLHAIVYGKPHSVRVLPHVFYMHDRPADRRTDRRTDRGKRCASASFPKPSQVIYVITVCIHITLFPLCQDTLQP